MDTQKTNNNKTNFYYENRGIQSLIRKEDEYLNKLKELSRNPYNNPSLEKEVNSLFSFLSRSWDLVRKNKN